MWMKGGAALQNVTAGTSEPKRRTIGREIAKACDPPPPAEVKYGLSKI